MKTTLTHSQFGIQLFKKILLIKRSNQLQPKCANGASPPGKGIAGPTHQRLSAKWQTTVTNGIGKTLFNIF